MWQTSSIAGKSVACFRPSGRTQVRAIYLHDLDGLLPGDHIRLTEWLESRSVECWCQSGGESWWTGRVCPAFDSVHSAEQFVVEHVAAHLQQNGNGAICLLGVGMGGQGALRIGFKHPAVFPIVASLDGEVDHSDRVGLGSPLDAMYRSREECRQDGAAMHIHPVKQPRHIWIGTELGPCYRGNDRLHEKLNALGVSHRFETIAATPGNSLEKLVANAAAIFAFLAEAAAIESRRLL